MRNMLVRTNQINEEPSTVHTETAINATATPILTKRMVKMTPGRSGSLSSLALVPEAALAVTAGGGGGDTIWGPDEGCGAAASIVLSCIQAGMFASAIVVFLCCDITDTVLYSNEAELYLKLFPFTILLVCLSISLLLARHAKAKEGESRWTMKKRCRPNARKTLLYCTYLKYVFHSKYSTGRHRLAESL